MLLQRGIFALHFDKRVRGFLKGCCMFQVTKTITEARCTAKQTCSFHKLHLGHAACVTPALLDVLV